MRIKECTCVCMCVCVCVCVYVCTYHVHVCGVYHMYTHVQVDVYVRGEICGQACTCMYMLVACKHVH